MTAAFYSVVQYVPSPIRGEVMNVGVVVVMPAADYIGFDFHVRKTRLSGLSSEFDPALIENFEGSLREWFGPWESKVIEAWEGHRPSNGTALGAEREMHGGELAAADVWSAADRTERVLAAFASEFAGGTVRLAPFRYVEMGTDSPMIEQGATLLDDLMYEFVKPARKTGLAGPRRRTPYSEFKRYLKARRLLSDDPHSGVAAHFKYGISYDRQLEFEFGTINGVAHLFETIDVEEPDITEPRTRKAVGDSLLKFVAAGANGPGIRAYSVLTTEPETEARVRREINPLDGVSQIYNIADPEQADALEAVLRSLRPPSGDGASVPPVFSM